MNAINPSIHMSDADWAAATPKLLLAAASGDDDSCCSLLEGAVAGGGPPKSMKECTGCAIFPQVGVGRGDS